MYESGTAFRPKGTFTPGKKTILAETYQTPPPNIIEVTDDKLRLVLGDYKKALKHKIQWSAPLGILLSLLASLLAADFTGDLFGIRNSVWEAMFNIGTLACVVWLVCSVIAIIVNWKKGNIEDIIRQLKAESIQSGSSGSEPESYRNVG